jgi:hypothetical protein
MNPSKLFVFAILGTSIVSVFFSIVGLSLPSEMSIYLFSMLGILIFNLKTHSFKMFFLLNQLFLTNLFFLLIVGFHTLFSMSTVYAQEKIILLIYLIIVKIFVFCLFDFKYIYQRYNLLLLYLKKFAIFILFLFFIIFHLGFTETMGDRVFLVGIGNPIWFSRFLVDLIFVALFYGISNKKIKFLDVIILISGFSLLFASGSRGPILSLVLVSILAFINHNPSKRKLIIFASLSILILLGPVIIPKILNFNIYSVMDRLDSYQFSISKFIENPWGYGLGSFGILYNGLDERSYPHNIFLEIIVELGGVGLIVFSMLIYYTMRTYNRKNIFFYLFLISFVNAQFSGDLASNNYVFVYMALSSIFYRYERRLQNQNIFLRQGKYAQK